jgi:hypothetical protein
MSDVSAPFGLRPSYHPTGMDRANKYTIASGYAANIFKGSPVILNTNGTVVVGTAAADLLGVFAGCEYTDNTGKRNVSPFWPTGQVATDIVAYVYDDPDIVYEIQSNGSIPQAAVGDQADLVNPGNGSVSTGQSSAALSSTLAGAGAQAQFRILGFAGYVDNAPGDAFTIVQVQLARSQFVANKVAI